MTGEQLGIDYSDTTPDLVYAFNRRGLNTQVTDVTGSRLFEHCICGKVTSETLSAGFYGSRLISTPVDTTTSGAKGRSSGLQVGFAGNPSVEYNIGYGYDGYGRLNNVAQFQYDYVYNSSLIDRIDDQTSNWEQDRHYLTNRDLLQVMRTNYGSTNVAAFGYSHDALGRRTSIAQDGQVFAGYVNGGLDYTVGYNARSEVELHKATQKGSNGTVDLPGRKSEFSYDPIGNRRQSKLDGRATDYTSNALNQYTAKAGPAYVDITGQAPASPTKVYAAGIEATRQGDYFFQQLLAAATATPRYTTFHAGKTPGAKSLNNVVSLNWQGKPITTPTVATASGASGQVLEFGGSPNHVLIESAHHGYSFINGRTYAFGFWARTLTGTRTIDVALTDDINTGAVAASHTIDTTWKWVSVTKTYTAVGAAPRAFYNYSAAGGDFQVHGATIYDLTSGEGWAQGSYLAPFTVAYTYDADGNLTGDDRWLYTWDAENRLTAMETRDVAYNAGTPRQKLEFAYDYLGRRASKKVFNYNGAGWVLASEKRFLYDGWNLVNEYAVSGGNLQNTMTYVWGLDLSNSLQGAGGVGGLLLVIDRSTGDFQIPAYDGNGNVVGLTVRNTGTFVAGYEYSPYGESIRTTGPASKKNPFRFSTKYTDDETGLVYYGRRYYDTKLGRFVGRDSIEEKGGLNLYGFVENAPQEKWDMIGQKSFTNLPMDERDGTPLNAVVVVEDKGGGGPSPEGAAAIGGNTQSKSASAASGFDKAQERKAKQQDGCDKIKKALGAEDDPGALEALVKDLNAKIKSSGDDDGQAKKRLVNDLLDLAWFGGEIGIGLVNGILMDGLAVNWDVFAKVANAGRPGELGRIELNPDPSAPHYSGDLGSSANIVVDAPRWVTVGHELGHALAGLQHPDIVPLIDNPLRASAATAGFKYNGSPIGPRTLDKIGVPAPKKGSKFQADKLKNYLKEHGCT